MRLIDADKLKAHYSWWNEEQREVFDAIVDMQPIIDAVPVVHGRWIVHNTDNPLTIYGECPFCNEEVGRKWNYCPNCGAKMDEVSE